MNTQLHDPYARLKVSAANPGIEAFVAAPKNLKIVGIVRLGMEFGLLAISESGTYVRVNGSQVVDLDTRTVREALRAAGLTEGEALLEEKPGSRVAPPTVVVRKRRILAPRLQLQ